jgi:hypothetical protein
MVKFFIWYENLWNIVLIAPLVLTSQVDGVFNKTKNVSNQRRLGRGGEMKYRS